ncbi:MAG: hypothetical protein MUC85_03325 [Anaerolineales bacterium]|jgi:hypothetical protein|nr:hypothetical protein [Anaerolineales bacterium]
MAREAYHAYLLRLWRIENDGKIWRVHLENVETGEVLGFTSLEKLMAFLQNLGEEAELPPGEEPREDSDIQ